mmetsp:Transcript_47606/g.48451  ORF Transcript_47606/g.48451 Transcript_47606/m.48451 type:complete len:227 (+) Transcript_47606:556-1236(+)
MCLSKAKIDHPNVRTLNTLLRGCLWCAATTSKDDFIVGGVVTAEIAWKTCKRLGTAFDVSSYQYSISLLCQALRVEDAMTRISEMKNAFGLSEERKEIAPSDDQSLTEAIAMSYCALARAYTILNKGKQAVGACETSLAFARKSKDSLKRGNSFSSKSLLLFYYCYLFLDKFCIARRYFSIVYRETFCLKFLVPILVFKENVAGKKLRRNTTIDEPNLMRFTVIIA